MNAGATARALGYRTAWSDPEYVRLVMDRSWWDTTSGTVERAPLPAADDPWLTPAPVQQDARKEAA